MSLPNGHPRVAVVLLNWNRPHHTLACLRSLEQLDYSPVDLLVVDNGSTDGSTDLIRREMAEVQLIENGRNLGFAAGCNVGIRYALKKGAEYVMLLNDDTEVASDLITKLVEVAQSGADIGMLGPTIYYFDQPTVIWSAGGSIERSGRTHHIGINRSDDFAPASVQDVAYATGCALLVKREVIESVGFLDERFFAYYEETEWCTRARQAGFRVVYVPQARVWHKVTPTARASSPLFSYLMARNRLLYLRLAGGSAAALVSALLDLLHDATQPPLQGKLSRAILSGMLHFLLGRFGPPPASVQS